MTNVLYYFHDPMCSWCWGYRPVWQELKQQLADTVEVRYVLGGLAPDNDQPMAPSMQQNLQGIWSRIHRELGTEFNFDFWTLNQPRRSTYPACRAVIAAESQGAGEAMIEAIQRGYYLRAMNPSDQNILVQLAEEAGLSVSRFASDLASDDTEQQLQQQMALAREWQVPGFPSLVLATERKIRHIPVDYRHSRVTLMQINNLLDGLI